MKSEGLLKPGGLLVWVAECQETLTGPGCHLDSISGMVQQPKGSLRERMDIVVVKQCGIHAGTQNLR